MKLSCHLNAAYSLIRAQMRYVLYNMSLRGASVRTVPHHDDHTSYSSMLLLSASQCLPLLSK